MSDPILWQSPELNLNGDPFFTVRKAKGYYIYGERAGIDSVAFILADRSTGKIGLINEPKPPLGDNAFLTTAFGGSLDKNLPLVDIVIEEVKEEAGYTVSSDNITDLGHVLVSTQMNQRCYLFMVDVTDIPLGERDLDENESGSTVVWINQEKVTVIEDWKAPVILLRFAQYLIDKD
jgi:8-oxo-dGTP pyrophosphatase MutT (NUDIX family)